MLRGTPPRGEWNLLFDLQFDDFIPNVPNLDGQPLVDGASFEIRGIKSSINDEVRVRKIHAIYSKGLPTP